MIIEKILKAIWKEFIYGGHLQTLGSVSIVLVSAILLNIKISWDILFISYFLFYPLYLYNRYKELKIDYLTNPQRTEYLKTYIDKAPLILTLVIFVLTFGLVYLANFSSIIFVLLVLLLGLLYSVIFKKITKKIPLFKNLYVATFFAILVFFPIIYYSYSLTNILRISAVILAVFIFLKAFMMQILLDLKDVEGDGKIGLLTFPTIFSEEATFRVLKTTSVFVTILIPIVAFYFNFFPKSFLMLILTIPFDFCCFRLAKEKNYLGYILMSGIFLLWPILILVGKIIL